MNRSEPQLVQSNRSATRRLHRRLALSSAPSCVTSSQARLRSAEVVAGLPLSVVCETGRFELHAAEMRIAELEQELTEARAAAGTDPLTGALNRRGFAKAFQRELARARRSGSSLALAHIDLDDFKRLNDTQGHQAGDRALVHLVSLLHGLMRPSDFLCRFGGEEFILMLPDTALEDAVAAVKRYLGEYSARPVPGTESILTFSSGVVAQCAGESLEALLARADSATYAAKHAGKNRVVGA